MHEAGTRKPGPVGAKVRPGGRGKPRPDYRLPNLTSSPIGVVNIRCGPFKVRFDAGRSVLRCGHGGSDGWDARSAAHPSLWQSEGPGHPDRGGTVGVGHARTDADPYSGCTANSRVKTSPSAPR